METNYQTVIWSTVSLPLLRTLWETTAAEDGGIPVQLGYEPQNPADSKAVMIAISTRTLREILGAELMEVAGDDGDGNQHWCLGYIRRMEPGREELWQSLQQRDALLGARLVLDGHD
jgi:hypothetical protein